MTLTTAAVVAGRPVVGVWLGIASGVAALQLVRVLTPRRAVHVSVLAGSGGLALPIAAVGGPEWMVGTIVVLFLAALVVEMVVGSTRQVRALRDLAVILSAALPGGLAAAAPVLARSFGVTPALVLFAWVWAYDAGSYVIGSEPGTEWEGRAAGIVCTIPVSLVVAALYVDPFKGSSPLVLGAIVAIGAPIGQAAARVLLAGSGRDAPALRRLGSLLGVGLVWAWAASTLLR